jgi:hypothetical protein
VDVSLLLAVATRFGSTLGEKREMRQIKIPLTMALVLLAAVSTLGLPGQDKNIRHDKQVVVEGRVVCLDGQGGRSSCDERDTNGRSFGFESRQGKLFKFSADDTMAGMFNDERVRQRGLQVTARALTDNLLEVIKVQSVKDGRLYDLYYFCEVCTITAYAPGICPCCGAEMEFMETPAQISD